MRYPLDGPVNIQSPYGPRGSGFHYGVDLYAMPGTPAYAVDSGEVFYTAYETAGGNHLAMYLDHPPVPEAPKAGYMHLERFAVGPGTHVNEGDLIGWTDTTGQVTGPHLHYWMGTNANTGAIDPTPYLSPQEPNVTIFGVDISKYQGPSAMDGYDFVILNVEDPDIGAKINHAYDTGVRWDIYKWCYPGQSGQALFDRARGIVNQHHRSGTRRPQFWLDYEEAGVETWQIDQWYTACDTAGEQTGLYIYLYLMNNQGVWFTRDGWLAYYPGTNDGSYWPSMSDTARTRGAKLHQYSSSSGALDKNVVLDEAWYHAGADDMTPDEVNDLIERYVYSPTSFGVSRADAHVEQYVFQANGTGSVPSRFDLHFLKAVIDTAGWIKTRLGL